MKKHTARTGMGPLSPRSSNLPHFIPPKQEFQTPQHVTNSTTEGIYTGTRWNIRPGGETHKQYQSKGALC